MPSCAFSPASDSPHTNGRKRDVGHSPCSALSDSQERAEMHGIDVPPCRIRKIDAGNRQENAGQGPATILRLTCPLPLACVGGALQPVSQTHPIAAMRAALSPQQTWWLRASSSSQRGSGAAAVSVRPTETMCWPGEQVSTS